MEQSIICIKSAINYDPNNPSYHSVLANYYREHDGKYEEAQSEINKAISYRKKQIEEFQENLSNNTMIPKYRIRDYALAEYYMWFGVIEHELGHYEKAIKCKEKALDYGYNNFEIQASICVSKFMLGEKYYERCISQLKWIIQEIGYSGENINQYENAGFPEYLYWAKSYLGLIMIKFATTKMIKADEINEYIKHGLGDLNSAVEEQQQRSYRNLLRRGQAYLVMVINKLYSSTEERNKYLDSGLKDLKESIELNSEYPDTWYALYIYYLIIGNKEEALRCWNPTGSDDKRDRHNYTTANHKPEPFGKGLIKQL